MSIGSIAAFSRQQDGARGWSGGLGLELDSSGAKCSVPWAAPFATRTTRRHGSERNVISSSSGTGQSSFGNPSEEAGYVAVLERENTMTKLHFALVVLVALLSPPPLHWHKTQPYRASFMESGLLTANVQT
jgi:hypothetical protein